MRATKIIATLGPASSSPATIDALVGAGVDVFRLNFSHGTQADHAARFHQVREAARRAGRHVAVLQDLSGPKLRTGALEGGRSIALTAGDPLTIAIGDEPGRPGRVSTTAAELAGAVSAGSRLLLDDGRIELHVESATASEIRTRVIEGGELGERKGIHAPGVPLPPGPTGKDLRDLTFGLALGVDLVALSFVRSADDVARARQVMATEGRPNVPLVAKLERSEAIDRLNGILEAADAVMVARGDLGIELPLERVPRVQREILRKARLRGVPVIVATEVLESMRTEPRPTRAEVSDAAGAVDAGADAIMLSGETAMGQHPVRAVEVLDAIIRDAELMRPPVSPPGDAFARPAEAFALPVEAHHGAALCDAAVTLAARAGADVIVAITSEGWTARLLAARRPPSPIVAATGRDEVARRLALWRGVVPVVCDTAGDLEEAIARAAEAARTHLGLPEGATMVFVNARPDLDRGGANFVRLRRV